MNTCLLFFFQPGYKLLLKKPGGYVWYKITAQHLIFPFSHAVKYYYLNLALQKI